MLCGARLRDASKQRKNMGPGDFQGPKMQDAVHRGAPDARFARRARKRFRSISEAPRNHMRCFRGASEVLPRSFRGASEAPRKRLGSASEAPRKHLGSTKKAPRKHFGSASEAPRKRLVSDSAAPRKRRFSVDASTPPPRPRSSPLHRMCTLRIRRV